MSQLYDSKSKTLDILHPHLDENDVFDVKKIGKIFLHLMQFIQNRVDHENNVYRIFTAKTIPNGVLSNGGDVEVDIDYNIDEIVNAVFEFTVSNSTGAVVCITPVYTWFKDIIIRDSTNSELQKLYSDAMFYTSIFDQHSQLFRKGIQSNFTWNDELKKNGIWTYNCQWCK